MLDVIDTFHAMNINRAMISPRRRRVAVRAVVGCLLAYLIAFQGTVAAFASAQADPRDGAVICARLAQTARTDRDHHPANHHCHLMPCCSGLHAVGLAPDIAAHATRRVAKRTDFACAGAAARWGRADRPYQARAPPIA